MVPDRSRIEPDMLMACGAPPCCTQIEPEDYIWQNLPGRCCFSGHWDNNQKGKDGQPKWVSVKDCGECDIWGQPDASCHRGAEECAT